MIILVISRILEHDITLMGFKIPAGLRFFINSQYWIQGAQRAAPPPPKLPQNLINSVDLMQG